jgi:hypothetical protein
MPEELLKSYWKMPPKKRVTARMHTGAHFAMDRTIDWIRETPSQLKIKKVDTEIVNEDPKLNMVTRVNLDRLTETEPQSCELGQQRKENYNKLKRMLQEKDNIEDHKQTSPIVE